MTTFSEHRTKNEHNPIAAAFPHCTDPKALQRFVSKVSVQPDGCWLWTAGRTHDGYGEVSLDSQDLRAHRLAHVWATGDTIDGWDVDHRCRNRACVKPSHLRRVTHQQNTQNRAGANRNSKSGVRGVYWHKQMQRWEVRVQHSGRKYFLGYFTSLTDAAEAARLGRLRFFTHSDMDAPGTSPDGAVDTSERDGDGQLDLFEAVG